MNRCTQKSLTSGRKKAARFLELNVRESHLHEDLICDLVVHADQLLHGLLLIFYLLTVVVVLEQDPGCRLCCVSRPRIAHRFSFVPVVPNGVLVESGLRSKHKRYRTGNPRASGSFGFTLLSVVVVHDQPQSSHSRIVKVDIAQLVAPGLRELPFRRAYLVRRL